jgi:hypothetical protein
MLKIHVALAAGSLLLSAQTVHATTGAAGLPADKLERAYACIGILYAELGKGVSDAKALHTMDRAAVKWHERAERLGGKFLEDGESVPAIDAAHDAYLAKPNPAQLSYCTSNVPG